MSQAISAVTFAVHARPPRRRLTGGAPSSGATHKPDDNTRWLAGRPVDPLLQLGSTQFLHWDSSCRARLSLSLGNQRRTRPREGLAARGQSGADLCLELFREDIESIESVLGTAVANRSVPGLVAAVGARTGLRGYGMPEPAGATAVSLSPRMPFSGSRRRRDRRGLRRRTCLPRLRGSDRPVRATDRSPNIGTAGTGRPGRDI